MSSIYGCHGKEYRAHDGECKGCPDRESCKKKFYETSVVDLAKGYSMVATVTGRMSSKEPNLSNYPKTVDGLSTFIFCQHAPPQEAMESLGLVWSFGLKAAFERHQEWFKGLFKGLPYNYGRDMPPAAHTPVLESEMHPVRVVLLPSWDGTLYQLPPLEYGVSLPGRGNYTRCRLCGGLICVRYIEPKVRWPRPAHLFSTTHLQTPLEKSFEHTEKNSKCFGITKKATWGEPALNPPPEVQRQDPDREDGPCESKFGHTCSALRWTVGFYNKNGELAQKRYRFCSTAVDMHRKRGNKVKVFRDEDEEGKPPARQEAFAKTFGVLHQEMRAWSEQIVAGMHVPIEFVFGGLQYSGSNVSMRMLEKKYAALRPEEFKPFMDAFKIPPPEEPIQYNQKDVEIMRRSLEIFEKSRKG